MRILRLLAFALLVVVFACNFAQAEEKDAGPAQKNVEQWFSQKHRNALMDRLQIFYDKDGKYAVAVVDYSSRQGGNAMYCVVGVFHKKKTDNYVFAKEAKPSDGIYGVTENVTFQGNTATVSAKVLKPGDPRSFPSGVKTWNIAIP